MAIKENYQDLTIRWDGHQKYRSGQLLEDDIIEVIVQKLEMILFTNKNEVFGDDGAGFGAEIEKYLWETTVTKNIIKSDIVDQLNGWLPELIIIGYELDIKIFEGAFRDIMEVNFIIKGQNVTFLWK